MKIKMKTRVMVRMRMMVRMLIRGERMRTVQVVDTTGVIYIETVIKCRLDHLSMNVVITQVFLRVFLRFPPEYFNQPLRGLVGMRNVQTKSAGWVPEKYNVIKSFHWNLICFDIQV